MAVFSARVEDSLGHPLSRYVLHASESTQPLLVVLPALN